MTDKTNLPGFGFSYARGKVWWIRYWWHREEFRESSRKDDTKGTADDARKLLMRRHRECGAGRFVPPHQEEKVTFDQLMELVTHDYQINGHRSTRHLKYRIKTLSRKFGGRARVIDIATSNVEKYKGKRLEEGKTPATVNRELAVLRRAFKLAVKQRLISRAPEVEMLREDNARQGFLEPAEFYGLLPHLPDYVRDYAEFVYRSGWRRGEARKLRWADVDRDGKMVRLRAENSKNGEPRLLPMDGGIAEIIERRWKARGFQKIASGLRKHAVNRDTGSTVSSNSKAAEPVRVAGNVTLSEYVFHVQGKPIGEFRKSWAAACKAIGRPGLRLHDFRRSAARNLRRAMVPESVAMKMLGHKTNSMFRRYSIVDEQDLRNAQANLEAFLEMQRQYPAQSAAQFADFKVRGK